MTKMREEINQIWGQTLDIAKWKLASVSAVTVAGLGLGELNPGVNTGILLLSSVGFLCAYLDNLIYRRFIAIHLIAAYLRSYNGSNSGFKDEKAYENWVEKLRSQNKLPLSERWGVFISSLIFSIGSVALSYLRYGKCTYDYIAIPILAVILNVVVFITFQLGRKKLRKIV